MHVYTESASHRSVTECAGGRFRGCFVPRFASAISKSFLDMNSERQNCIGTEGDRIEASGIFLGNVVRDAYRDDAAMKISVAVAHHCRQ